MKNKKIIWIVLLILLIVTIIGGRIYLFTSKDNNSNTNQSNNSLDKNSKTLIVYYSYSGTTKRVAELMKEVTNADIYEIKVVEEYPKDMYETSDRAEEERTSGNLPELKGELPDITDYDTILIGGPVWSSTLASPVMTYLEKNDFTGKNVAAFWTDLGNEGNYKTDFAKQVKGAKALEGLRIQSANSKSEKEIKEIVGNWSDKIMKSSNSDNKETAIKITANGVVINATLNNTKASQELISHLPLTISMTRMGEHEYYGSIGASISETDKKQTGYEVGDIAYWTPGDLLALYFDEPDKDPEGLIILGKITSPISVFDNLKSSEEMKIELAE